MDRLFRKYALPEVGGTEEKVSVEVEMAIAADWIGTQVLIRSGVIERYKSEAKNTTDTSVPAAGLIVMVATDVMTQSAGDDRWGLVNLVALTRFFAFMAKEHGPQAVEELVEDVTSTFEFLRADPDGQDMIKGIGIRVQNLLASQSEEQLDGLARMHQTICSALR